MSTPRLFCLWYVQVFHANRNKNVKRNGFYALRLLLPSHVILSEARAKNLYEVKQRRDKVAFHRDSSAHYASE